MSRNSILYTKIRPTVIFDPENPEHRRYSYEFLKDQNWKDCPYIFAVNDRYSNVHSMITAELSKWYGSREFEQRQRPSGTNKTVVKLRG